MQLMFTLLIPPDYRAAQVNVLFMKCLYPGVTDGYEGSFPLKSRIVTT